MQYNRKGEGNLLGSSSAAEKCIPLQEFVSNKQLLLCSDAAWQRCGDAGKFAKVEEEKSSSEKKNDGRCCDC